MTYGERDPDDYLEARRKMKEYSETAGLQSEDEGSQRKRKKKMFEGVTQCVIVCIACCMFFNLLFS